MMDLPERDLGGVMYTNKMYLLFCFLFLFLFVFLEIGTHEGVGFKQLDSCKWRCHLRGEINANWLRNDITSSKRISCHFSVIMFHI